MIRIRDISMPPAHNPDQLIFEAARLLHVSSSKIRRLQIVRRSIDARKKPDVKLIYTVDVTVEGNEQKLVKHCKNASIAQKYQYFVPKVDGNQTRPVIVGFGPGGMFAGLVLAMAGLRPIILERGEDAQSRHEKVSRFFATGQLDPGSNIQFGEGGAGTFSDGKLNTGVNNPRISWILEQFVAAGAREDILYDAKPHIGSDVLLNVVQNIRKRIISLGGEVRFQTHVTGIQVKDGALIGLETNQGPLECDRALFAIGHSARDTFQMLHDRGIAMEPKPFAMGVRIEHKQSMINEAQYGDAALPLPPADYKLVSHLEDGSVYTFCMCPGGQVVAAASEEGGIVTNGMSNADRDGDNANSALLVSLNPRDFPYDGPLGGMYWQRDIEQAAYKLTNSYRAPAQRVGDLLSDRPSTDAGAVKPTYLPGVHWCHLRQVLPERILASIKLALPELGRRLKGFDDPDSVLTAPESRSSSPVRIVRDESRQASLRGLYPVGEGAGYAGGIMSAAIDGMMTAETILKEYCHERI